MPRARATNGRRKANASVLSTTSTEDRKANLKLLTEDIEQNEKGRRQAFIAKCQRDLEALSSTLKSRMAALPKKHLEMNFYEYLKMKRDDAEGRPRESLNETIPIVQRPGKGKENDEPVQPKTVQRKAKKVAIKPTPASIFVPPLITPKCDSTKPLSAIPTRNFVPGEMLFSIAGSPVDPSRVAYAESSNETTLGAKRRRGRARK